MKVKRRPIAQKYSAEIDNLYTENPDRTSSIYLAVTDRRTRIAALSASGRGLATAPDQRHLG